MPIKSLTVNIVVKNNYNRGATTPLQKLQQIMNITATNLDIGTGGKDSIKHHEVNGELVAVEIL